jgi:hypothetical protein
VSGAGAQVLTAAKCMATEYTPFSEIPAALQQELARVGTHAFAARRPQTNYPDWAGQNSDALLRCSWTVNPVAEYTVQMILQAPQDPADDGDNVRIEPAGKQSFRGGVLWYKRHIAQYHGIGTRPDLVTYHAQWVGATGGGLLGIAVDNVLAKEAIPGVIAEVIDKTVGKSP